MHRSFAKKVLGAGVATALLGLSPLAKGSLVVDLVPTSGSSGVLVNGSTVTVNNVGDVVHFNVVATVTGQDANPNNDGLQAAFGNISGSGTNIGSFAGTAGTTSTFAAGSLFSGTVQKGFPQDLGSGGVDLGFKVGTDSDVTRWVEARAGSVVSSSGNAISQTGGSSSFLLGTVDWVKTVAGVGTENVHWTPRISINTVWNEDGGTNSNGSNSANYLAGPGVTIAATPEPGSLALLGLGGLGLLLRRRRAM